MGSSVKKIDPRLLPPREGKDNLKSNHLREARVADELDRKATKAKDWGRNEATGATLGERLRQKMDSNEMARLRSSLKK